MNTMIVMMRIVFMFGPFSRIYLSYPVSPPQNQNREMSLISLIMNQHSFFSECSELPACRQASSAFHKSPHLHVSPSPRLLYLSISPSPHLRVTLSRYPSFEIPPSAISLLPADSYFLPTAFCLLPSPVVSWRLPFPPNSDKRIRCLPNIPTLETYPFALLHRENCPVTPRKYETSREPSPKLKLTCIT